MATKLNPTITNTVADTELRPTSLKGVTLHTETENGLFEVLESAVPSIPARIVEEGDASTGEVVSQSGGKLRLLCIPTDVKGPYYGGSLVYKSGCFDEWIKSDGDASIRADAHGRNPRYQLAARSVGTEPGGVTFNVDNVGLWAEVTLLPDDEVSKNALARIKAKMIKKCSVGTTTNKIEDDYENDITTVLKCDVRETSLVYTDEERFSGTDVQEASSAAEPIEKMMSLDEQDKIEMKATLDNLSDKIDAIAASLSPKQPKSALEKLMEGRNTTTTQ